jgi:gas vesicle protein
VGQSTEELTSQIRSTREDLAQDLDALGNRVSPHAIIERRKSAARDRMHRARNRVMGSVQSAQQSAADSASSVSGTVSDTVSSTAQGAMHTAEEQFEGAPLAAGLIAFGAGMVISAMVPPSDAETRAAQQVVDVAKDKGQPVIEEMKQSAQEVGDSLKDSAAEATQQLKESASESAEKIRDETASSAQEVTSQAQNS